MPAHRSIIKTKKVRFILPLGTKLYIFYELPLYLRDHLTTFLFDLFCFHPIGLHAIQFDDAKSALKLAKKVAILESNTLLPIQYLD